MLSASDLAAMQAVAAASLDITCQIQRNTPVDDGYGHRVASWATIATVNAGMARPSAQVLQLYAERLAATSTWVVSLPLGTNVKVGDRLILAGVTVSVQADLTQSSYSTLMQLLVSEARP